MRAHGLQAALVVAIGLTATSNCQPSIGLTATSNCQTAFGPPRGVGPVAVGARTLTFVDMNGDGYPDALSASDRHIAYYVNDGFGAFVSPKVVAPEGAGVADVRAADLDGDGDVDPVVASFEYDDVVFYRNEDGAYAEPEWIVEEAGAPAFLFLADIDGEDGPDALVYSIRRGELTFFRNDGDADFDDEGAIVENLRGLAEIGAADADGDGDLDLFLAADEGPQLSWRANDGSGEFGDPTTIGVFRDRVASFALDDLDQDGDPDLLVAADGMLSVFHNDGGGAFGEPTVVDSAAPALAVFLADYDLDGDPDIFARGARAGGPPGAGGVTLYENLAGGGIVLKAPALKTQWLEGDEMTLTWIAAGVDTVRIQYSIDAGATWYDVADGVPADAGSFEWILPPLSTTRAKARVVSSEDSTVFSEFDRTFVIAEYGDRFGEKLATHGKERDVAALAAGDLDQDGDLDLVSASKGEWSERENKYVGGKISWREGFGEDGFTVEHIVAVDLTLTHDVALGDLDQDGDLDVLAAVAGEDKVLLFENLGYGEFAAPIVVTDAADQVRAVAVADLDQDDDLDVVVASWYDNTVAWYENLGARRFGGERLINAVAGGAQALAIGDFDGDGDPDVAAALWNDNAIAWYRNDGNGEFGGFTKSAIPLAENAARVADVAAADVDRDGDLDIVAALSGADAVAWYENLGDSTFGEARVVDDRLALVSSIFAEDIDRDGDPDLVAASSLDGVVVYYENGGGVFGEGFVAAAHDHGANDAILCDYDNDGDADLVVGFTNAIFFAENETPAPDPNVDNPNESDPNADD
ncbi:MAG: hypothetical protein GF419_12455, partial [Ignavibacteriales bacterium]|nr:hypothetical protein [Ignavibacteriales bacterium]